MSVGDVETRKEFDSSIKEKNYSHSMSFDNVFDFMDFCKKNNLTHENSVTYWSEALQRMFIAY